MINLTDDMRNLIDNALANGSLHSGERSAEGEPDIGYKGSMMIFDNESLPIGNELAVNTSKRQGKPESRGFIPRHQNPGQLALSWNGDLARAGRLREQVMARTVKDEIDKDPERKRAAVSSAPIVVTNLAGQVRSV